MAIDAARLREAPLSVLSAELTKTKPVVLVNHDPSIPADSELARDIANTMRGWGIEATTFSALSAENPEGGVVGYSRDKVDIFIDVVSVARAKKNEGAHEAVTAVAENVSLEIPGGTRLFPVVNSVDSVDEVISASRHRNYGTGIGVWDSGESSRKRMLLGLLIAGPKTRRVSS